MGLKARSPFNFGLFLELNYLSTRSCRVLQLLLYGCAAAWEEKKRGRSRASHRGGRRTDAGPKVKHALTTSKPFFLGTW